MRKASQATPHAELTPINIATHPHALHSKPARTDNRRMTRPPTTRTSNGIRISRSCGAAVILAAFTAGTTVNAEDPTATAPPDIAPCKASTTSIKQLAIIDTTGDGDFQCLGLSLDIDSIKTIRLESHHFPTPGRPADSETIEVKEFPPDVLDSSQGAVLDGVPGHDAIILRGHLAIPPAPSDLVLSYLYNGITGTYLDCKLSLERSDGTTWRLLDHDGKAISHIVVRTRELPWVGGIIGIASLDGACGEPEP
jgi:hypothetical protein